MKKISVIRVLALICMAFFVLFASACPNATQEPIQASENGSESSVMIKSIETAMVGENNKPGNYVKVKDFNNAESGPYAAAEEAKTAYVYFKLEVGKKPSDGKDFSISLENMNTYLPKVSFTRGRGADAESFVCKAVLSKGINLFAIETLSPDRKVKGEYKIKVNYAGGPDETFIKQKKNPIPGIYCPAQRKPSPGEKEDFVWAIYAAGFWDYCDSPLGAAGKGKLVEKYREQGLRVIVVSGDKSTEKQMFGKWEKGGGEGNYLMYTDANIVFRPFFRGIKGVPFNVCIKEWKKFLITAEHKTFEDFIKEAFGFK